MKKMKKLFNIRLHLLSCLFLISFHTSSFANDLIPFSNLFIFGDSLSDIGNIDGAPYTNRNPDGSASIWANHLAGDLGLGISDSNLGGNDYAQAGAVTGNLPYAPSTTLTVESQIQNYLAKTNGKADSRALYAVWGGGNDIRDALWLLVWKLLQPQALISASTDNILNMANQLHDAGAKYILVPNVPDISESAIAHNHLTREEIESLHIFMQAYDAELLSKLNGASYDIIQIDVAGMLSAVQQNYQKFGFIGAYSYTCNPLVDLSCSASLNNQNIFNEDEFHPSQASHQIIADYMLSILEGPALTNLLSQSPVSTIQTQHDNIQSHLETLESGGKKSLRVGEWEFFTQGNDNSSRHSLIQNTAQFYPNTRQHDSSFTAGVEDLFSPNWILGFALGHSNGKINSNSGTENFNFDQAINMINIFSGHTFWHDKAYLNTQLGYGKIYDDNIQRNFRLGICPETLYANTQGNDYSADVDTGYYFQSPAYPSLFTGPFAALGYQRVNIRAYEETSSNFETDGSAFDALQYQAQNDIFLNTELGWRWKTTLNPIHGITLSPRAQIGYLHSFISNPAVEASVTSLPGSHYSVPSIGPEKNFALASTQIDGTFQGGFTVGLGYNIMAAKHFISQGLMVDVSIPLSKMKK